MGEMPARFPCLPALCPQRWPGNTTAPRRGAEPNGTRTQPMSALQKHEPAPGPPPPTAPAREASASRDTPRLCSRRSAHGLPQAAHSRGRGAGGGMPRGVSQEGEPETGEDRGPRGKASGAIYADPAREEAGPGRGPAGERC